MFIPKVNETLTIGAETYRFTAHPAAKDMPYGQTGRKATVFQLIGKDGKKRALKVFSAVYRSEENLYKTSELLKYAAFPGLATCERFVISRRQFPSLIQQKRDLDYSVLMPWIEGQTWQDIVLNKQRLTKDASFETALELNRVLATMEVSNIAHCDLSGPNIILRPPGISDEEEDPLSLIDLEEMYAPDLSKPKVLPAGSAGYAHSTASKGLWSPYADRFAGSVLLANMLTWNDASVVDASYGENYFSPDEMHTDCTRYQKLSSSLEKTWGKSTCDLFSSAWHSAVLNDCPSFADWASEFKLDIEEIVLPDPQTQTVAAPQAPIQEYPAPQQAPPSQPAWKVTPHRDQRTNPYVNQTPITINSRSPVSGFRPLYGASVTAPQSSPRPISPAPTVQQKVSAPSNLNLRTDFTEINRLADWIEDTQDKLQEASEKVEKVVRSEAQKVKSASSSTGNPQLGLAIIVAALLIIILVILITGGYF